MSAPPAFSCAADWPAPLTTGALDGHALAQTLRNCAEAAARKLAALFPVAARIYGAERWLLDIACGERGLGVLREIASAMIAADCFRRRCVSPRLGSWCSSHPWRGYETARIAAAGRIFQDTLTHWAIAQRIPAEWIPEQVVFAEVGRLLAAQGFTSVSIAGHLRAPTPGGMAWLAQACAADRERLRAIAHGEVRAAVIFWGDCVTGAVVCADTPHLVAHAPSLQRQAWRSNLLQAREVAGLMLIADDGQAPHGRLQTLLERLGMSRTYWSLVRAWRRYWRFDADA